MYTPKFKLGQELYTITNGNQITTVMVQRIHITATIDGRVNFEYHKEPVPDYWSRIYESQVWESEKELIHHLTRK
jgi:hypothetical protein